MHFIGHICLFEANYEDEYVNCTETTIGEVLESGLGFQLTSPQQR